MKKLFLMLLIAIITFTACEKEVWYSDDKITILDYSVKSSKHEGKDYHKIKFTTTLDMEDESNYFAYSTHRLTRKFIIEATNKGYEGYAWINEDETIQQLRLVTSKDTTYIPF